MKRTASSLRTRPILLAVALIAASLTTGGCIVRPGSEAPPSRAPSGVVASAFDDATDTAIRIRTDYGLPHDLDTIRRAAADPDATTEFGTPLLPSETADLIGRGARTDPIVEVVQRYIAEHRDVSGGVWVDQAAGGVVTVSFTDEPETHRHPLAVLLAGAPVRVVAARYAENRLRAVQDSVFADSAWFRTIPAALRSVGYEPTHNVLEVDVSSTNPDIASLISARYGVPADALAVHSDGTGEQLLAVATIRGRVITSDGNAPGDNSYTVDGRTGVPGHCGGGDVALGVRADGTFELPCTVGHWTIVVLHYPPTDGPQPVLGQADVEVPDQGEVRLTIRLDPPH